MHRNDLNIKNKVNINTKSYINNWNKLALHFRITHTKSILINVYVYCKNGKKFYNLIVIEKQFSKLSDMYFLYLLPLHSLQTAIFWDHCFFVLFCFNSFIERCSNGKSANGTRDPCEALSLLNFVYI
jgi:hypothetical protein